MSPLSQDAIRLVFTEMDLQTEELRARFLRFSASAEATDSPRDLVFIRLENKTSIHDMEEPPNAQLA